MSSLLGGPSPTKMPAPTPPPRMPDSEDPAVVEAKRKSVQDSLTRGGRASTILTGRNAAVPGGGDAFSSQKLG